MAVNKINWEGVVYGELSLRTQEQLKEAHNNGWLIEARRVSGWFVAGDPSWHNCTAYRATEPPKKYRPWTLVEAMHKYIRTDTSPDREYNDFYITEFGEDGRISVLDHDWEGDVRYCTYSYEWLLEHGECLRPDGTITPCGEVSEC
jgi:hypothetical protein